jgi:uncharacterized protein (TIGR00369 family)
MTVNTSPGPIAAAPRREATSLESSGAFVAGSGLIMDHISSDRVIGHIVLGSEHHTPWGIVHGGVYATAVESAASIGATTAVADQGQVAVGLTNTTHFLRSLAAGRVTVDAVAMYQGRTHQLWRVDITDESGRLVAHGELRLQNIAAAPSATSSTSSTGPGRPGGPGGPAGSDGPAGPAAPAGSPAPAT